MRLLECGGGIARGVPTRRAAWDWGRSAWGLTGGPSMARVAVSRLTGWFAGPAHLGKKQGFDYSFNLFPKLQKKN
jgi:hypothetical protein